MRRNLGFRFWFYFRSGWSSYFAFIMAAINTLTVTYFLAIERYPLLEAVFPTFIQYIIIVSMIGIPLLILVGYAHWKKTPAYRSEADIWMESNPYQARMLVNTEILFRLNLKLTEMIIKQSKNEKMSEAELDEISKLKNEFSEFDKQRTLANKKDIEYFKNTNET